MSIEFLELIGEEGDCAVVFARNGLAGSRRIWARPVELALELGASAQRYAGAAMGPGFEGNKSSRFERLEGAGEARGPRLGEAEPEHDHVVGGRVRRAVDGV